MATAEEALSVSMERKKAGAEVAQTESATTSLRGAPSAEKQSAATMKYEAAVPD